MRIRKFTIIAGLLVLWGLQAEAQRGYRIPPKDKFEVGVYFGASNYQGDLEDYPINYNRTDLSYGGLVRYNLTNNIALRFGLDAGTIEDADKYSSSSWRRQRNLSFKTSLFDGYIGGEYYITNWRVTDKKYVQPYLFAGIGAFHFNPQAEYNGIWYDLRPLGTEGQGTLEYPDRQPYDPNQIYIPFGGGFRFMLSSTWFLSVECRLNKTFTDYLDDVSTTYASPDVLLANHNEIAVALANRRGEVDRNNPDLTGTIRGNPSNYDWFFYTGFVLCHSFHPKYKCYSF